MSALEQAVAQLTTEGHRIVETFGRNVSWICKAGHQRKQGVYDVLRGHRCAKCKRSGHKPRATVEVSKGTKVGNLVCIEFLGVVDGHSRVRVQNTTNDRVGVVTTYNFLRGRQKLLSSSQKKDISAQANALRRSTPNPKNAKYDFGDLVTRAQEVGLVLLHPVDLAGALFDTRSAAWTFRCSCGELFTPQINNVLGNTRSCGCIKSLPQREILDFVRSFCPDAVHNDRKQLGGLELDVWIPSRKMAIEYCGLFWHGERMRDNASKLHLEKLEVAERAGVRLITIFEDEWTQQNATVRKFLAALLGAKTRVIGARKCEIVLDSVGDLTRSWHLQGRGRGERIGLVADGQIVAEATFSQLDASRSSKGGWELNRFVTHPDVSVPGALGRLIGAFWTQHPEVRELISFCDRRWSQGGVYKALGFRLLKKTPPSFWWFKDGTKRYHRYTYRTSRVKTLFPGESGTGVEIMFRHGWDRIWDCGTTKWALTK
jgi:hypothetical protein